MYKLAMQIIYIYTNDVFSILLEQRMPFDFAEQFFFAEHSNLDVNIHLFSLCVRLFNRSWL